MTASFAASTSQERPNVLGKSMERIGIEPMTSWLQSKVAQLQPPTSCRISLGSRLRMLDVGSRNVGGYQLLTSQKRPKTDGVR